MVAYWNRLQPEMDARGMSISALAEALKISFQAVAKVRDGGAFGSANNIKAAKLFGVRAEWLATGSGPKYAGGEVSAGSATDQMPSGFAPALEKVAQLLDTLPSVLQPPARDILVKWAEGRASILETSAALDALLSARKIFEQGEPRERPLGPEIASEVHEEVDTQMKRAETGHEHKRARAKGGGASRR